ncbi:hypothetical protein [Edaphobacillus lindanitolerans]|uniref:Uncharacterized protein n=1 Tax=Edaphobacillus lindanitolerans TaxID=550447 RepID=A0A1U7PQV1_9BACI|nr:hypothetical protein [Edaphobacillus lindanitolerans]SIT87208.1 hypothetical protein SAMN05428946_2013 [Edaphobacillus lindanitolerans]
MNLLKYRSNCRIHYRDGAILFTGDRQKFSIRATETVYTEIHRMLGELSDGVPESRLSEGYPEYGKLLELLEKQDLLYRIDAQLLERHGRTDYFRIVETEAEDVDAALRQIAAARISISTSFEAGRELAVLLRDNGLSACTDGDQEDDVQVRTEGRDGRVNVVEGNGRVLAIAPANRQEIGFLGSRRESHDWISPGLVAPFVFSQLIMEIIGKAPDVFLINEDAEVERKRLHRSEDAFPVDGETAGEDPFARFNRLERFVGSRSSRILSFNGNPEYEDYRQRPLQVLTIQYADPSDTVRNLFLADLDYERLADFVSATAFREVMRRAYGNERKEELNGPGRMLGPDEFPEWDTIRQLIEDKGMELSITAGEASNGEYWIRIGDLQTGRTSMFDFRVAREFIPLAVYSYISAKENGVDGEALPYSAIRTIREPLEVNGSW